MARRRSKSDRRRIQRESAPEARVTRTTAAAQGGDAAVATPRPLSGAARAAPGSEALPTDAQRSALRPWRNRVSDLLDHLHAWSRAQYGAAVEHWLAERFGSAEAAQAAPAEDVERALEDYICARGSAGDDVSILSVFVERAPGPDGGPLDPEDRDQARRWERERSRGVFLLQHAARDRLTLWDPLEGAPLTLHLLRRLGEARTERLARGTVVTATYQPWMARLVAVGGVEFFDDARAISLFREETLDSGAQWHEAPPAAPQPSAKARK